MPPSSCFGPLKGKRVLAGRCLANGHPLVRCYSGFQAVFTEPLPSNGHIRHNIRVVYLFVHFVDGNTYNTT
jgi:hypothetical protein